VLLEVRAAKLEGDAYTNARIATVRQANNRDSGSLEALIFSRTGRTGSIVVSGLLAALAVSSVLSGKETFPAVAIAVITLAATVMLWLHHRYAVYAWALLFAAMAVGYAVVERVWAPEPFSRQHILSYWGWKLAGVLIMFGFAFQLLRLGKRITDRRV